MIFLYILFVLITVLLVFMVVITPSHEGGMAAAFGGMGSDTFFGTKAHQHISKFTVFLAIAFIGVSVLINALNSKKKRGVPPPAVTPAPVEPIPK